MKDLLNKTIAKAIQIAEKSQKNEDWVVVITLQDLYFEYKDE